MRQSTLVIPDIRKIIIPILLVVLSFALRLALISKGPYHVDTLNTVMQAENTLHDHRLHYLFGPGYPLTVLLACLFIAVGKLFYLSSVFSVNFMSVVFSSLAVGVFYLVVKDFHDELTSLLSAVLLSLSPIYLGLSVYGKSHIPGLFFLFLGLYYLQRTRLSERPRIFAAAVAVGLMGACRIQDLALVFPAVAAFFFLEVKAPSVTWRRHSLAFLKFSAVVAGVVVGAHLPFLFFDRVGYVSQFTRFWHVGVTENFLGVFSSRLLVGMVYIVKSLTVGGFVISLVGLLIIGWQNWRRVVFLLLWILIPFLFYSNLNTTSTSRFFVVVLPPLVMAQGWIFSGLIKRNKMFASTTLTVYCTILFLLFGFMYPKLSSRHRHAFLPEFCRWTESQTENDAVIITSDDNLFFTYYAHRQTLPRPRSFEKLSPESLALFRENVVTLLKEGKPVYITTASLYGYDKERNFSGYLKKCFSLELVGQHLYEDWHRGCMTQRIFFCSLYRLNRPR